MDLEQPKRVTLPVPRLLGERAKTKTKTKTGLRGDLKPVLMLSSSMITALKLQR